MPTGLLLAALVICLLIGIIVGSNMYGGVVGALTFLSLAIVTLAFDAYLTKTQKRKGE